MGRVRISAAFVCIVVGLVGFSPVRGAEEQPAPSLSKIVSKSGQVYVVDLSDAEEEILQFLDIETGKESSMPQDSVRRLERDITTEEAVKWAGLAPYLAWRLGQAVKVTAAGQVVRVTPTSVYVNLGSRNGIELEDRLRVYREGEALIDPETGEELGAVQALIAELTVTEAEEKFAKGRRDSHLEADIQPGDRVKVDAACKALAVLPLSAGDAELAGPARRLRDEWATTFADRGLPLVERKQLDGVLSELALQHTGLVDAETAEKLGKLAGAYAVVTGSVVKKAPGMMEVHARVVKVRTGEVLVAASEETAVAELEPASDSGEPRQTPAAPGRATGAPPAGSDGVRQALMKPVSLTAPYPMVHKDCVPDKMSVQDAVTAIAKEVGLGYDWTTSYENTNPTCRVWITPHIVNVPCHEALEQILGPKGLTYEIRGNALVLTKEPVSVHQALTKRVSLTAPYPESYKGARTDKMAVQYAVIAIAKQAGLAYNWDASYKNTNPTCRVWITPHIVNVPCQQALGEILGPKGLTYEIRDGKIVLKKR